MKASIASKRVKFGRHLFMVGFLLGITVVSTSADVRNSLFMHSGIIAPEPVVLAIFGSALISLGFFFRRQPSDKTVSRQLAGSSHRWGNRSRLGVKVPLLRWLRQPIRQFHLRQSSPR